MRRAERYAVQFKMIFDDGETYGSGFVDDISLTGLFLECATPLAIGTVVTLEPVERIEDVLFEVHARVVRIATLQEGQQATEGAEHGLVGMGLEYTDLTKAAEPRLEKMIAALVQRAKERAESVEPYLGDVPPSLS